MIRSVYENSLDHPLYVESHSVTASREAPVFDIYPNPIKSSQDSLDFITNALAKIQLKSCQSHTLAELLDNLREVASIDDLPFQRGTPLGTERETGSEGTVLADYDSDLESFSTERLVLVIIQQPKPSQHDPNEALDQISADNLTQDAPPDEDEATRTARRARNRRKEERRVHAAESISSRQTSKSMTVSKTLLNGYVYTRLLSMLQEETHTPRPSTSRWPWNLHLSPSWRA